MEEDEFVHAELTSFSFFVSIGDIPLCSEGKRGKRGEGYKVHPEGRWREKKRGEEGTIFSPPKKGV